MSSASGVPCHGSTHEAPTPAGPVTDGLQHWLLPWTGAQPRSGLLGSSEGDARARRHHGAPSLLRCGCASFQGLVAALQQLADQLPGRHGGAMWQRQYAADYPVSLAARSAHYMWPGALPDASSVCEQALFNAVAEIYG